MTEKIRPDHLRRTAYVYVRQSSAHQVRRHQESRQRQYALADRSRALGFAETVVIDEDQGKSGSGRQERSGFGHLLTAVCQGQAGAVFALEASRLARNNGRASRDRKERRFWAAVAEQHAGGLSAVRALGTSSAALDAFRKHPISDLAHRTGRRDGPSAVDAPPAAAVEPHVSSRDAHRVGERRKDRPDPLPRLAGHPPANRVVFVRHSYILSRGVADRETDGRGAARRTPVVACGRTVDLVGGNVGELLKNAPPVVLQEGLGAAHTAGGGPSVIDTPLHTSDAALTAGREANLIIIPCQPATADLHGISTTIDIARIARKPVVVVINRALVGHPANDEARKAIRACGVRSCPLILHQRIDHQHAFAEGLSGHGTGARRQSRKRDTRTRKVDTECPNVGLAASERRCGSPANRRRPGSGSSPGRQRASSNLRPRQPDQPRSGSGAGAKDEPASWCTSTRTRTSS